MLKVVIVDDSMRACNALKMKIARLAKDFQVIGTFTNPQVFVSQRSSLNYDALFLDIEMKMQGFSGFDLHKNESKPVVFVTGTAIENIDGLSFTGIEKGTPFITKPIDDSKLVEALDKLREKVQSQTSVMFKTNKGNTIFDLSYIQVICSPIIDVVEKNGITGYTDSRDKILFERDSEPSILRNIKYDECLSRLPSSQFCQISKQVIVAKKFLRTITATDVFVRVFNGEKTKEEVFAIGEDYKPQLKAFLSQ